MKPRKAQPQPINFYKWSVFLPRLSSSLTLREDLTAVWPENLQRLNSRKSSNHSNTHWASKPQTRGRRARSATSRARRGSARRPAPRRATPALPGTSTCLWGIHFWRQRHTPSRENHDPTNFLNCARCWKAVMMKTVFNPGQYSKFYQNRDSSYADAWY